MRRAAIPPHTTDRPATPAEKARAREALHFYGAARAVAIQTAADLAQLLKALPQPGPKATEEEHEAHDLQFARAEIEAKTPQARRLLFRAETAVILAGLDRAKEKASPKEYELLLTLYPHKDNLTIRPRLLELTATLLIFDIER